MPLEESVQEQTFTLTDIWPDGDAPENPILVRDEDGEYVATGAEARAERIGKETAERVRQQIFRGNT